MKDEDYVKGSTWILVPNDEVVCKTVSVWNCPNQSIESKKQCKQDECPYHDPGYTFGLLDQENKMSDDKPNCPYCGSTFGSTSEFMWGCTDYDCPEMPRYHDPVGCQEYVDEYWEKVIRSGNSVKLEKLEALQNQTELVRRYYQ